MLVTSVWERPGKVWDVALKLQMHINTDTFFKGAFLEITDITSIFLMRMTDGLGSEKIYQ